MGDIAILEVERTIKAICKAIRKEGDCEADKLTALSKLVSALSKQESQKWDPLRDGDPGYYPSLEESYFRQKQAEREDSEQFIEGAL